MWGIARNGTLAFHFARTGVSRAVHRQVGLRVRCSGSSGLEDPDIWEWGP